MNCNCPNSSYGTKHTAECYEARIRELEAREATWNMRHERETKIADVATHRVRKLEAVVQLIMNTVAGWEFVPAEEFQLISIIARANGVPYSTPAETPNGK